MGWEFSLFPGRAPGIQAKKRRFTMDTKAVRIGLVLMLYLVFVSIGCNENPLNLKYNINLLLNESFEEDHISELKGWRFGNPQVAQLVNDAPPGGGNRSLQLTADWTPTSSFIYRPITNVRSGDIVKLSAFVRAAGKFGGKAVIKLSVGMNPYSNRFKYSFSRDTVWKQISVMDTLMLEQSDTLWVILSSPITEIVPFQQRFDLVKLQRIPK